MFVQAAIIGRRDGTDLEKILEGYVDRLGTAHYPDTRTAHRDMHFKPDLVLLYRATKLDIEQARGILAWEGRVICVADDTPDQHHTHKDGVHYCDPDHLSVATLKILRETPRGE